MTPSILERIQSDLAVAMKARDSETLSTLRMLKAAIMELKTQKAKDADDKADKKDDKKAADNKKADDNKQAAKDNAAKNNNNASPSSP